MLNKAAFVLCMFYIIFIVCSWTLHKLCDLCLSDSLYFFVKYFNKMKLFFTTYSDMLLFSPLWTLLQAAVLSGVHATLARSSQAASLALIPALFPLLPGRSHLPRRRLVRVVGRCCGQRSSQCPLLLTLTPRFISHCLSVYFCHR